ncbi:MAG: ATPase domain-containing protein, partial [Bdellovibrionota bacterium]
MTNKQLNRCSTGTPGLDEVLRGGLPRERMYLLRGEPGTGKTTLALKFLLEGVKQGEKCLYITFSETRDELEATAESHGWSLHGLELFELTALEHKLRPDAQSTIFHPSEIELAETTQVITSEVERIRPSRIVFDSASEMRLMAETSLRYRRQLLALKQYFSGRKCTVLFLDDLTASGEGFQIE